MNTYSNFMNNDIYQAVYFNSRVFSTSKLKLREVWNCQKTDNKHQHSLKEQQ